MITKKQIVVQTDIISENTIANQIPSIFQIRGKTITATTWNTKQRKNEINAEIKPLFKAVKKDDPKIEIPENKKLKEKILKALDVNESKFSS